MTETATATVPRPDPALCSPSRRRASIPWARLLARIDETRPLTCPRCQRELRLIAFLTEPISIRAILRPVGEPSVPPPLAPHARAPPDLDTDPLAGTLGLAFDQSPPWDLTAPAPDSGLSCDQTRL